MTAVSVEELRQVTCYDDDIQHDDDPSSQLDSDSEPPLLPQRKVGLCNIISASH